MSQIKLETRYVGDIRGKFILPDYQRGYRWGSEEVKLLLDDIFANADRAYCLQPVVVKNLGKDTDGNDLYELIDGQQRLTTIFLIYTYMYKSSGGFLSAPKFRLTYQTREHTEKFLADIDPELASENIDFFFISRAYSYIESYFEDKGDKRRSAITRLNEFFDGTERDGQKAGVSVIWYEIPPTESGIELFERLNIGKIPLTSSELVKALFLRDDASEEIGSRREEISLQWDNMERELRESSLWGFLTNSKAKEYPTRIDLILDLIAGRDRADKEKYRTFFYFDREISRRKALDEKDVLLKVWKEIFHTFLTLKEWHNDHDFYHKIGYLIASGAMSLHDIYKLWNNDGSPLRKNVFTSKIDKAIRESVSECRDLGSLSYSQKYNPAIERLLLLMNVETERILDGGRRRFPFDRHKNGGHWSLEHIHAQHSEGLRTNEQRRLWLSDHARSLRSLGTEEADATAEKLEALAAEIGRNPKADKVMERMEPLHEATITLLSETRGEGEAESVYIHRLSNLALIDSGLNAALSNYVFDAKRNIIVDRDKRGTYIPFCTKMVFLKYYSGSDTQLHFWGERDRSAYLGAIKDVLGSYLPGEDADTVTDTETQEAL